MSLSFGVNPLLLLVVTILAGALTYWSYRRTVPELPLARKGLLAAMRFVALFIILFLLFEPLLRRFQNEKRSPSVAILVDDSQSIRATGKDSTGIGVRGNLALLARQVTGLNANVRVFRFSTDLKEIAGHQWSDSIRFAGGRTDIARALDQVRDELEHQNLRAVVLVSDGQYNAGRNPLFIADRFPAPIHTIVLGDTTRRRDVLVRRVVSNEIAYVGSEQPIQVGLQSSGYDGVPVSITLRDGGTVLGSGQVTLREGVEASLDLTYTPTRPGIHRFTVSAAPLAGEQTTRNNAEAITVRVLDQKRRVLLLAGAPDPDVAAVRQVLEATLGTDILTLVQKAPGAFYEGTFPANLSGTDAMVLVNYPGRVVDPAILRRVGEAARAGTPVFFMLGSQTNLAAVEQYLGDVIPATPVTIRQGFVEAEMTPSPQGLSHPLLNVPGVQPELWQQLPPVQYSESRWQASPDAQVLATTRIREVAMGDPLLVVRSRGGMRSAALLGAGVWRWRSLPQDLERLTPLFPSLLSNTIQWVSTREDRRRLRVHPIQETFAEGEPVRFTGEAYDESLKPLDDVAIDVEIRSADGRRFAHRMEPVGNGRYVLEAGIYPPGTYQFSASGNASNERVGTDSGIFGVGGIALEYKETRADAELMRQIAQRSGGRSLLAAQVNTFTRFLRASNELKPEVTRTEAQMELWRFSPFLVLVLALLSAEWFIRKRSGMV